MCASVFLFYAVSKKMCDGDDAWNTNTEPGNLCFWTVLIRCGALTKCLAFDILQWRGGQKFV